jgi:hypothetical protein
VINSDSLSLLEKDLSEIYQGTMDVMSMVIHYKSKLKIIKNNPEIRQLYLQLLRACDKNEDG